MGRPYAPCQSLRYTIGLHGVGRLKRPGTRRKSSSARSRQVGTRRGSRARPRTQLAIESNLFLPRCRPPACSLGGIRSPLKSNPRR